MAIYYRLTSILFLAALGASIYLTLKCQEQLEKDHFKQFVMQQESVFPKIFHVIQYFATGSQTIFILVSFWLISLSAQENRDLISLSLILMMCQRSLLLPTTLYLSYQSFSSFLLFCDKTQSSSDLDQTLIHLLLYLSVSFISILALFLLEIVIASFWATCIYICRRGPESIGHDALTID